MLLCPVGFIYKPSACHMKLQSLPDVVDWNSRVVDLHWNLQEFLVHRRGVSLMIINFQYLTHRVGFWTQTEPTIHWSRFSSSEVAGLKSFRKFIRKPRSSLTSVLQSVTHNSQLHKKKAPSQISMAENVILQLWHYKSNAGCTLSEPNAQALLLPPQTTPRVPNPPLEAPRRVQSDPTRVARPDFPPPRPPTVRCPKQSLFWILRPTPQHPSPKTEAKP